MQTPEESARITLRVLTDRIVSERGNLIHATAEDAAKRAETDTYNRMYEQYNHGIGFGGRGTRTYDDKYNRSRIELASKNLTALEEAKAFLIEQLLVKYVK